MKLIYKADDNPQLRVFVAILYPDNEDHNLAIKRALDMPFCSGILHDLDEDEKGEFKKAHYHLIFRFDKGYYKKKLVTRDLFLDWDQNWHYFKSLSEIEYVRADDYAVYNTHIEYPQKHYYPATNYEGGDRNWAIECCKNYSVPDDVNMTDILDYIEEMYMTDHQYRFRPLKEIYMILYKKYGYLVYRKWNFIKEFVKDFQYHQGSKDVYI